MLRDPVSATNPVQAVDQYNENHDVGTRGESHLILYVDGCENVNLMTIGAHSMALALGYLRNQRFVDRHTKAVNVTTRDGIEGRDEKFKQRTVTTGRGQGVG